MLEGARVRLRREQDGRAWAAWHTAYLSAYAPARPYRFPKLERLLGRDRGRRQTAAEMLEAVKTWMRSAPPDRVGGAGGPRGQ